MSALSVAGDTSGAILLQAPAAAGNNTQNLQAGSGNIPLNKYMSKAASGTIVFSAADGTDIPAWAKKITIGLANVSTTGSGLAGVQLGTGAGPTFATTGYNGNTESASTTPAIAANSHTTLFLIDPFAAASVVRHGVLEMVLTDPATNTWSIKGNTSRSDVGTVSAFMSGSVSLPGGLTALKFTTSNGDTYDLGNLSVLVEG